MQAILGIANALTEIGIFISNLGVAKCKENDIP